MSNNDSASYNLRWNTVVQDLEYASSLGWLTTGVMAGGGITQLTGDVTAGPGVGSQPATLATVNSNVGSFTTANITVNAKGLITAAASGTSSQVLPQYKYQTYHAASIFTTSTSFVSTALTLTGTLQKSTNKWKIKLSSGAAKLNGTDGDILMVTVHRDAVDLQSGSQGIGLLTGSQTALPFNLELSDAPGDTASHTYTVFIKDFGGNGAYLLDLDDFDTQAQFILEEVLS